MYALMLAIKWFIFKVCGLIKFGNSYTAHTYVPLFLVVRVFWYVPNTTAWNWHHSLADTWIFCIVIAGLHVSTLLLSIKQNDILVLGVSCQSFLLAKQTKLVSPAKGLSLCVQFAYVQDRGG